jgi:hypothetical protein
MNIVKKINKRRVAMIVLAVLALALIPYNTTVVPEWKIQIIDERKNPVRNVLVDEHWRNHSIELHRHSETRVTDNEGYVSFPRRTVRSPLLIRAIGRLLANLNVHGESGPKASAIVLGPYLTSRDPQYSPNKPSPEVIEIRPQP